MQPRRILSALAVVPVALVTLAGCDLSVGSLVGRATEEWKKSYPLAAAGEVRIGNTNGRVEIEGIEGTTVEVRAEKIARGATDAAAQELLPRIKIIEDAQPDRLSIETERMNGIMIGASFEVRYHVRAPKQATITVTTSNGGVGLTALAGKVVARTTNGGVTAKEIAGGIEARSTNGGVSIDLASVGADPVSAHTTNGGVTLFVPDSIKADVSASCTNGGIIVAPELSLTVSEQSRRRLEGKLNGGGTHIDLQTTNGGVRIKPRGSDASRTDGSGGSGR